MLRTPRPIPRARGTVAAPLVSAIMLGSLSLPASAQILDQFIDPNVYGVANEPGVTVASRGRPELDPAGVRVGNVVVRPQLNESVGYESNVLGTRRARGSPMVQTTAAISAASDWSRNSAQAEITVDDVRYPSLPRQSFTNWTATLGGTYEIGRDVLTVQYQHLSLNQTTRGLDVPFLERPIGFDVDTLTARYRVNLNRVSVTPGVTVANYDYSNGVANGLPYLQGYRDRVVVTPSVAAGYEFSPRRSVVLVVRDAIASYTNSQAGLVRRDYHDPALLGGIDYDLTGLLRVRLLAGYEARVFSSAAYRTIQSPIVEASAIWNPTALTTLTGTVARRIQDTADDSTAAFTQTSVSLRVDHELRRNLLLRGSGAVYFGEYDRGVGNQTLYTAGASATYFLNRNARLSAAYDFQARSSGSGAALGLTGQSFGSSYTDHRVLLTLRLAL